MPLYPGLFIIILGMKGTYCMPNSHTQPDEDVSPELELALISLGKAKQDLVAVGKWLTDTEIADEIIGFHIQQTIEKSLKAVLLRQTIDYPHTHNLRLLVDLCRVNNIPISPEFFEVMSLTVMPFSGDMICYPPLRPHLIVRPSMTWQSGFGFGPASC